MWSLPELEDAHENSLIGQFKHTFSHYHLKATVVSEAPEKEKNRLVEDKAEFAWHNISDLHEIALPTPIKKFLFQQLIFR